MHKIYLLIGLFFISFSANIIATDNKTESFEPQGNDQKVTYYFLEALKAKHSGNYDAAFELLTYCKELNDEDPAVLYELAMLQQKMNDNPASFMNLKKAASLDFTNYWYQVQLAELSEKMHLFETAIETYESMVRNFPEKPELNYDLASAYAQSGDTEDAIKALDRLEEIIGVNETISMQKYRLYTFINKEKEAYEEIDHLVKKFPYELKYVVLLGDLYLQSEKPKEAYRYYQKALNIDPDNAYLAVSLANYYEAVNDKDAAKEQMSKVLMNSKIGIEEKVVYLGHYLQQNVKDSTDVVSAEVMLVKLIEENPQDVDLHTMYGSLLLSQNKHDEAKSEFEIVVGLAPDDRDIWMQLISLEGREKQYESMVSLTERALEQLPETPEFYFYKGIAYYQLEDYEYAIKAFEEGLAFIPKEDVGMLANFYGQIGDISFKANKKEKAFDAYDKALELDDRNILILNNYAYFLAVEKKNLDKAEKMSAITVKLDPSNSTYLDTYAWVFFMKGDYTLAKFYLESAMNNGGKENGEILEHYGDVLFKEGKPEEAVEYWKKAVEAGYESDILKRKIETQTYLEAE